MILCTIAAGRRLLAALCAAALLSPGAAQAVKVSDFHADQLLFVAQELKATLNLSPNQLILWQQVGARSAALLRTRQLRRDRMQADLKRRLAEPAPDLRALLAGIDDDDAAALGEDRQLRELWLGMHDALDDRQRALVVQLMASQLERVDADPERGQRDGNSEGKGKARGGRQQRPGGMGGMGGPGGQGGPG